LKGKLEESGRGLSFHGMDLEEAFNKIIDRLDHVDDKTTKNVNLFATETIKKKKLFQKFNELMKSFRNLIKCCQ
jgi:endonuclease IV